MTVADYRYWSVTLWGDVDLGTQTVRTMVSWSFKSHRFETDDQWYREYTVQRDAMADRLQMKVVRERYE